MKRLRPSLVFQHCISLSLFVSLYVIGMVWQGVICQFVYYLYAMVGYYSPVCMLLQWRGWVLFAYLYVIIVVARVGVLGVVRMFVSYWCNKAGCYLTIFMLFTAIVCLALLMTVSGSAYFPLFTGRTECTLDGTVLHV